MYYYLPFLCHHSLLFVFDSFVNFLVKKQLAGKRTEVIKAQKLRVFSVVLDHNAGKSGILYQSFTERFKTEVVNTII